MLLGYLTEEAYDRLLSDVEANAEKYAGSDEWLKEYFNNKDDYFSTSKSVDVGVFTPYIVSGAKSDAEKSREDLINVRALYDVFRGLSPLQASNKYMWTYLCHAIPTYREYIRERWMSEVRENTIKTRFFVTSPGSLLNDNALSRLWWYGHLTFDAENSNHYALTEILLMNQTICTDVMDTLNRMSIDRIKGVLWAIRDFRKVIGAEGITEYFRECKKYLNHYAAVTTMDFLEPEEIRDLAFNYMVNLKEQKGQRRRNKEVV